MLAEFLSNNIFSCLEGQIGDKNCLGLFADAVAVRLLAIGAARSAAVGLGFGEVDVDGATIELGLVHGLLGFDTIFGIDEFDIAESMMLSVR